MDKNLGKKKIFLLLIIISLLCFSCKKKFELYRFIDHLEQKNVISSPLINLEQKFEIIEQEWLGREMVPLELNKSKFWTMPTEMPILCWDEAEKPDGMKMLRNGEEIEFSHTPLLGNFTWKWKRIEEYIEPANYKGFKTDKSAIILSKNKYFVSQNIFLPEGEVIIEITAQSGRQMKYLPYLTLYLNDQPMGETPVGKYKKYKFIHKIPSERYKVKIGFSRVAKLDSYQEEENLLLDKIEIKSNKDLILISQPLGDSKHSSKDTYKAIYYTQPVKNIIYSDDFNNVEKNNRFSDLILKNSKNIEKKIELDSGVNIFEIICYAKPKGSFLSLWIDDKKIGRKWIIPWERKSYLFKAATTKGEHNLKIKFFKPNDRGNFPDCQLFIHTINIISCLRSDLLSLYRIKNNYSIHDLGIGDNPNSIKKKLKFNNYSINALFAPPKSEFKFNIKIPKSGILEFGYGILENSGSKENIKGNGVIFSILLEEDSEKKKTLFSKHINPNKQEGINNIGYERIDISPFQEKRVKLYFITKNLENERNLINKPRAQKENLSFWYNPVILQKRKERNQKHGKNINVILISIDTLRADHLGCYGYERNTSPNIDKLAKEGVLFTDTFSPTSSTLPSHMSMLTSLYPVRHRLCSQRLGIIQSLNPSIITLSDLLRKNNYFTGAFTGGAYLSSKFGFSKGFDFYYEDVGSTVRKDSALKLFKYTSNWLKNNHEKKFFLFLHTYQVHAPYFCPEPYNLMYLNKNAKLKEAYMREILGYQKYRKLTDNERENIISLYDGEIRYTDEYFIKLLVDELKKLNIYDKTMIIFTSDHGEEFYEHKGWLHEHSLYNELIEVPLIIKFPYSKYKDKKIENTVRIIDIIPTILQELGINYPKNGFDGKSTINLIKGEEKKERSSLGFRFVYLISPDQSFDTSLIKISFVLDSFKLILNHEYPKKYSLPGFKVPGGPPFPVDDVELFNFKKDPLELNNIAEINKEKVRLLLKKMNPYYLKAKGIEKTNQTGKSADQELKERLKALGYIR